MRPLMLAVVVVILASAACAQARVGPSVNVDRQPVWGPTGYDRVEFYYLPDIEAYYNVPQRRFYYQDHGRWLSGTVLPPRYRGFDLFTAYKVVVNEPMPYRHHAKYKKQYDSFRGRRDQSPIRDSLDPKYFVNAKHPEHQNWSIQQRR